MRTFYALKKFINYICQKIRTFIRLDLCHTIEIYFKPRG